MAISKRTRFEVFKRDNFTCQYCGRQTPSVILQIDHVVSQSQGGSDEINNLVTSCVDCNQGKSDIPLWKRQDSKSRIKEIELLKEKQQQIAWYEKAKAAIHKKEKEGLKNLNDYWSKRCGGTCIWNENGLSSVREFLKFLTPGEIKEAIDIASDKDFSDIESQFRYFCGICHNIKDKKLGREDRANYRRIKNYFLSFERSEWFNKNEMIIVAKEYDISDVLEAIDRTMSPGGLVTGGYWSSVMRYLENEYEPKTASSE